MPFAPTHILIVDDNEEILEAVSIMLTRNDYRVTAKNRVENFEQEVRSLSPSLILLDKNLGWVDGCDLCRLIKSISDLSVIPIIMFSAYYKKKEDCLEAGANNFLEKPFQMKLFLEMIASYVR